MFLLCFCCCPPKESNMYVKAFQHIIIVLHTIITIYFKNNIIIKNNVSNHTHFLETTQPTFTWCLLGNANRLMGLRSNILTILAGLDSDNPKVFAGLNSIFGIQFNVSLLLVQQDFSYYNIIMSCTLCDLRLSRPTV